MPLLLSTSFAQLKAPINGWMDGWMDIALEREAGATQVTENISSSSRAELQLLCAFALLRFGCHWLCFKPFFLGSLVKSNLIPVFCGGFLRS